MRVIFAGTPGFAVPALRALARAGHDIRLVLTQPDRAAGRGLKAQPSAVKQAAIALGLPVFQPEKLKDAVDQTRLAAERPDVMVVVAYGLILPQAVLDIPTQGALNIHASLLPRWRGAAPIQRAIEAGDDRTGVGIMQMEAGLDTGPVLLEVSTSIARKETAGELQERLSEIGAEAIVQALANLATLRSQARPQSAVGMTYATKISKADAHLDWRRDAVALVRQIRALNPAPGASTRLAGEAFKIWSAEEAGAHIDVPGLVLTSSDSALVISCGKNALSVFALQRAGGKRLPICDFQRGNPLKVGARFDIATTIE